MKTFWHYYIKTTLVNLVASILLAFFSQNIYWLPILFATFGIALGILAFDYYYKHEYYFYHNMGYTRLTLALKTFYINLVIGVPVLTLIILFA
ncbi:hypothetical protein R1T16_00245 [Flavobacterium sp. DG1-102-2]|uniref:hypothetical protein n=1 Tax=Flavobacterium sp. DG1-102-2 TaxID=3081663 RepID=UPI0029496E89|nr:hypothetical protein [Flavobacterium sp. DG1-102-2]MDV6166833.1 hypothetical protein [Flavobacterium sp. DG1-102-2]